MSLSTSNFPLNGRYMEDKGKNMPDRAIIYGDIVDENQRRKINDKYSGGGEYLLWKNEAEIIDSRENLSQIFVDLDNPIFSAPDFLMSLVTTGENVKIVGKLNKPSMDEAIRVSKMGVSELLTPDECLKRLHDFLDKIENIKEITPGESSKIGIAALYGASRQVAEIRRTIALLSDVDFPSALILGETGTGKSLICKILHNTGIRARHNLVEVNCSAIPDELFESELFGHTRGAFTGAKTEKMGLFEYAQDGTLFLDEVGNLTASAQGKLLKILEDKKLRRVGDINEKDINVRVVAATNINLGKAIEDSTFREDLYFRLNLLTIEIPPLRERPEDIPEIIGHYLSFYSTLYRKPEVSISESAVEEMQRYKWPGNVRELCNIIERAVLLTRTDKIKYQDIKDALKKGRISASEREQIVIEIPPQGVSLKEIEQDVIKQVLNMCSWNKSEAAKFLKISRPRLRRILESIGVEQNRRKY